MKNSLFLGLGLVLFFLGPTGCQKSAVTKPSAVMEEETNKKTEIKKVVLTEPIKIINDYLIKEISLESPRNIQQIVDLLPSEQIPNITDIDLIEKGSTLESLRGIGELKNLDYIAIQQSKIWTIGDVKISDKIRYLFLGNCQISETSSLEDLDQLISLGLYGCPIKEVGDFSKLKNLRNLSLDNTSINGLNGEKLPHSLRYLGLRETKFKSLRAIESTFLFVETIDLSHGAIESVDDIKDFGRVQQIGLYNNPVMEQFRDKEGNVPQRVDYKGVCLVFVEPDF